MVGTVPEPRSSDAMLPHYSLLFLFLLLALQIRKAAVLAFVPSIISASKSHHVGLLASINAQTTTVVEEQQGPRLIFPGGGLFFYWQAGVISYLKEKGYNLSDAHLSGASAGALSATLAATGVDFYEATELALSLSEDAGVWDRPLGLQGIWGDLIHTWLDKLLPQDADVMASEKLHILVTPVPSFGKKRINKFETREDLINCNLASVHLPWFLNGDMTKALRGQSVIDGSFLAKPADYFDSEKHVNEALILDFKRDPVMRERSTEFVKVRKGKQFIWDILEQGRLYANIMDKHGEFRILPQ